MVNLQQQTGRPSLLGGVVFLVVLCGVFYAALTFFSGGAAVLAATPQRMLLAVVFCAVFSLYLGSSGVRVTGRVWVAPVVHMLVCAGLLLWDIPVEMLVQEWDVTLTLIAGVGTLTGFGAAWTWLRRRLGARGGRG